LPPIYPIGVILARHVFPLASGFSLYGHRTRSWTRITSKRSQGTRVPTMDILRQRGDQHSPSLIVLIWESSELELTNKGGKIDYYNIRLMHLCTARTSFALWTYLLQFPLPCLPCLPSSPCLYLVSCSLTCTLTLPPFLIMERVSPIVHLTLLACVLVVFLLTLPLLHWRLTRLHSILGLFRQPQTWIMILKFMFDFSLVILHALDISRVILMDNGKSKACLSSGHVILMTSSIRNTALVSGRPHSLLLHHTCNKRRGMSSLQRTYKINN